MKDVFYPTKTVVIVVMCDISAKRYRTFVQFSQLAKDDNLWCRI